MIKPIQTQRLKLIPLSLEQLQLLSTDLHQLEDELGFAIDEDNTNETVLRAINIKLSKMTHLNPAQHPWLTYWLIVIADKSLGAGLAGFKGTPNENGPFPGPNTSSEFDREGPVIIVSSPASGSSP